MFPFFDVTDLPPTWIIVSADQNLFVRTRLRLCRRFKVIRVDNVDSSSSCRQQRYFDFNQKARSFYNRDSFLLKRSNLSGKSRHKEKSLSKPGIVDDDDATPLFDASNSFADKFPSIFDNLSFDADIFDNDVLDVEG